MSRRDRFNGLVQRHEIAWELGMGLLAILYVAVGFALDDPTLGSLSLLIALETALTIVFIAEFASRLAASQDRQGYLRGHWIDLLALIPVARGLRIARLFRVLRLTRLFGSSYRALVRAERMRGAEGIALVVVGWTAVTAICCIALYAVEGDVNPAIKSPLDAAWWGVTTISTVGYGDIIPVTAEGRLVASALMLLGIGLFGAITAIVTNTLLASSGANASTSAITDLERLAGLRASEAISHEEFEATKSRLLARV
jgi:voltage-gated potassium channel